MEHNPNDLHLLLHILGLKFKLCCQVLLPSQDVLCSGILGHQLYSFCVLTLESAFLCSCFQQSVKPFSFNSFPVYGLGFCPEDTCLFFSPMQHLGFPPLTLISIQILADFQAQAQILLCTKLSCVKCILYL